MTKAEALDYIKKNVSNCIIDDFIFFTVKDWYENKNFFTNQIIKKFVNDTIIIRSSSIYEDASDKSCAGKYLSIADVNSSDTESILHNIERVIDVYEKDDFLLQNQVIVQKQATSIKLSGVLFNYDYRDNSPYYLIEYDDSTKRTDTVTGFGERKRVLIAQDNDNFVKQNNHWGILIAIVTQIENLFDKSLLFIEFAIDKNNEVHIFQVRVIKNNFPNYKSLNVLETIKNGFKKYLQYKNIGFNIFSNMSDWNPIEMLGSNPKPLSVSLYLNLISNRVWKTSREALGYFTPSQDHLINVFCGKPYVNVACSLLSLTPNNLSSIIRKKILESELQLLREKKYLHDKIEFEIALSSIYLNLEQFHLRLKEYHLSDSEIAEYTESIQTVTFNMIKNQHDDIEKGNHSLEALQKVIDNYKSITQEQWNDLNIIPIINELIENVKDNGIFYFSILARQAFVGDHLTKQLLKNGYVTDDTYQRFYSSITTIPDKINLAIQDIHKGILSKDSFLSQYGHLRINTYDIESPQYSEIYNDLLENVSICTVFCDKENVDIQLSNKKVLFDFTIADIFDFTRKAIEYRETFKYEFTKTVSFILELLKQISIEAGISIAEFAYLELEDFLNLDNREKEFRNNLLPIIKHRKEIYDKSVFVKLPDVISDDIDFYCFEEITAKPNFVTTLQVTSDVLYISDIQSINPDDLKGKIILKETMEPGCDWIFLYSIAGIITKFGGVASHIAIRCRELNIPAVIGCGNYFDVLKNSKIIKIDSLHQEIYIITK